VPKPTTKPNIIFLTDDEHRWDFCSGGLIESLETPALDRLKKMGVTLSNAVTNSPICMPARFTWLTGLYASQSAAGPRNGKDWPKGHPTVAHAMQRAGYNTALIGKLHSHAASALVNDNLIDLEDHTKERGFDYVFECSGRELFTKKGVKGCRYTEYLKSKGLYEKLLEDYSSRTVKNDRKNKYASSVIDIEDHFDSFVSREIARWLDEYSEDKPFFLHASIFGPHYPLDPPEEYFKKFKPEDMPVPAGVDDSDEVRFWQEQRAVYAAFVEFTDSRMGLVLDAVEKKGLLDNTIIIYTTDHGDMMGDHGMGYKNKPYEASVRAPTVVWDPASKLPGGTVLTDSAEGVDIPATILEAGSDEHLQTAMPGSPAKSFLKYARGETDSHRDWAYAEIGTNCEGSGYWRMARTSEWKYVKSGNGDMLFNLEDDPFECNNLAEETDQLPRINEMRGLLIERLTSLFVPPASVTCEVKEGYYEAMIPGENE
jgi:choline-sulfatase